jgi:hypothetical protein
MMVKQKQQAQQKSQRSCERNSNWKCLESLKESQKLTFKSPRKKREIESTKQSKTQRTKWEEFE